MRFILLMDVKAIIGEDEDGSTELDEAEKQREWSALADKGIPSALCSSQTIDNAAKTVFENVRVVPRDGGT